MGVKITGHILAFFNRLDENAVTHESTMLGFWALSSLLQAVSGARNAQISLKFKQDRRARRLRPA
jgi:hypothetical protein